jgi:hypothetical protein
VVAPIVNYLLSIGKDIGVALNMVLNWRLICVECSGGMPAGPPKELLAGRDLEILECRLIFRNKIEGWIFPLGYT